MKIATNAAFRAPDSENDSFLIDLTNNTNVSYPFSMRYKAEAGDDNYPTASASKWLPEGFGKYNPDNLAQYSDIPVVNPNNYTLVN